MRWRPRLAMTAVLICVLASGCLRLDRERPQKRHFLIEGARDPEIPAAATPAGTLRIRRFSVGPALESSSFVYRLGESAWESDYYNLFFVAPDVMLTEQTARWFKDSGLFARVTRGGSQVRPDFLLEGHLVSLHGDYRDSGQPEAVIEIQFLLLRDFADDSGIVFQGDYVGRESVNGNTPDDLVAAWNSAFDSILRNAERDLARALADIPKAAP